MHELVRMMDIRVIDAVQSVGPAWYPAAWLISGIIGSLEFIVPAFVLALFLIGKKRVALEVVFISLVSLAVVYGLKLLVGDHRPALSDGLLFRFDTESDFGMPSGHAFMSMVVFGWVWLRHPRSLILSLGAGTIVFLIGLSRIYLGAHFPSQVVAGWVLGLLFLWLFSWIDRWYFRPLDRSRLPR